ncbi:MAG: hypothetical protein N3A53_07490, partial [Verrucomicrobiae bacterium]|nr:hypothetical protein [Verrucomicrobiae bacterium]
AVVVIAQDDDLVIFGINDTDTTIVADLLYGVFELAGKYPLDRSGRVTLEANASTQLAAFSRSLWRDPRSSLAFAMSSRDGELLARHRLVLPLFKELRWPPARVTVRVNRGRAIFSSPTFVWGVCLDLDGEQWLVDNFFDLFPGIPYSIPWSYRRPPKILYTGNLHKIAHRA